MTAPHWVTQQVGCFSQNPNEQRECWDSPGGHRGGGSAGRKLADRTVCVQPTRTRAQTLPNVSYEMQLLNQASESSSPTASLSQQLQEPVPGDNRPGEGPTHIPETCHQQELGCNIFQKRGRTTMVQTVFYGKKAKKINLKTPSMQMESQGLE